PGTAPRTLTAPTHLNLRPAPGHSALWRLGARTRADPPICTPNVSCVLDSAARPDRSFPRSVHGPPMLSIGQRLLATRCLAAALQMTVRRARAGNSKAGSMTCLSWPRSGGTVPRRNALRIGTRRQMATGAPVLRPADGAAVRSEGVEASGRDRRHRPADPQPAVRAGANLDRARPPGEPALVDQQGLPGRAHAVVQQVAS